VLLRKTLIPCVFLLSLLVSASRALALEGYEEFRLASPYNQRLSIQAIRYAPMPKNGAEIQETPIILPHGFSNNTRAQKHLGLQLREMGYETWMFNWRGHGIKDHKTIIRDPLPGDYGFAGMVTEDLPTVVDFVHAKTGKKVIVAGFSMGGMAAEQYVRGVAKIGAHGIGLDPRVRAERAKKLKALMAIGSPTHFEDAKIEIKALAKAVWPQIKLLPEWVPLSIMGSGRAPTAPDSTGAFAKAGQLAWMGADFVALPAIPSGLWNTENVSPEEFAGVREKGFSDVHRDIIHDFGHWTYTGRYEDPATGFKYRNNDPLPIPYLRIVGGLDRLAPVGNIKRSFKDYPPGARVWLAIVQNTGHMDLVVGKNMTQYVAPTISAFERDPESLGLAQSIIELPACSYKPPLLKTLLRKLKK